MLHEQASLPNGFISCQTEPMQKKQKLRRKKKSEKNEPVTKINLGEHFLGAACNLLVQNEKGIMRAIHNSQTPGICANNFSKLIASISSGLVCNGFATSPAMDLLHHPLCKFLCSPELDQSLSKKLQLCQLEFAFVSIAMPRVVYIQES